MPDSKAISLINNIIKAILLIDNIIKIILLINNIIKTMSLIDNIIKAISLIDNITLSSSYNPNNKVKNSNITIDITSSPSRTVSPLGEYPLPISPITPSKRVPSAADIINVNNTLVRYK